jgi:hypothetical protein
VNTTAPTKRSRDIRPRTAAVVAGFALLAMAIIAGLANFGVINSLVVPGDPDATAVNLVRSAALFRLGAVALIVVAVLDVVVAWALYSVFRSVNPSLSLLGAWLRLVYAASFALAINNLFSALRAAPMDSAQTEFFLETFDYGWQIALFVFGLHLIIVGLLAWRSGFIYWLFGALLIISGLGYLVDALGKLLSPHYSLALSAFTFIGEVVFIFWLLIRGRKLPDTADSSL